MTDTKMMKGVQMYYDDSYEKMRKAMEQIVNPPYLRQLQKISNPPWIKEMERLSKTMKSYYDECVIPQDTISQTIKAISTTIPTFDTKGLGEALRPLYANESLLKSIDVPSATTHMAESLTAFSSSVAAVAKSQQSIEKLSMGLSKSIPNLFADYDLESVLRRVGEQSHYYDDSIEDSDDFEWDDIQFNDNEIEYQGTIVTRDDVDVFMNSESTQDISNNEWKKKFAVIMAILSTFLMLMQLLDLPNNWAVQEILQLSADYKEEQNHQYFIIEDSANVYQDPECSSEIVECLSYGTVVEAIEDDEFWIKTVLRHSPKEEETVGWIQKTKIEKYISEDD